jgi:hypothetical protein
MNDERMWASNVIGRGVMRAWPSLSLAPRSPGSESFDNEVVCASDEPAGFPGDARCGRRRVEQSDLASVRVAAAQTRARRFVIREDRFGRMFPNFEPFFQDVTPRFRNALLEIGNPGGMLNANDSLISGPTALIVDPDLNVDNPNNPTHTAGTTFMGPFIDQRDVGSSRGRRSDGRSETAHATLAAWRAPSPHGRLPPPSHVKREGESCARSEHG